MRNISLNIQQRIAFHSGEIKRLLRFIHLNIGNKNSYYSMLYRCKEHAKVCWKLALQLEKKQ